MKNHHVGFVARPEVIEACRSLGATLKSVLEELRTEAHPWSARGLAARLGVDKTLAWSVMRIANLRDHSEALAAFPGERGWQSFVLALRRTGCQEPMVRRLFEGISAMASLMKLHGIDRESLRLVAHGGLPSSDGGVDDADDDENPHHLRLRRRFFEASKAVWGVSASGGLQTVAVVPGRDDPARMRLGLQRLIFDLNRQRIGSPWPVYASHHPCDGSLPDAAGVTASCLVRGDPISESEFQRSRRCRSSGTNDEVLCFEFLGRDPSRSGPLSISFIETLGETEVEGGGARGVRCSPESLSVAIDCTVPKRLVVFDVLVHRSIHASPLLEWRSTTDQFVDTVSTANGWSMAARETRPQLLDRSLPALPSPLSGNSKKADRATGLMLGALGVTYGEMILYRVITHFPPVPSHAQIQFSIDRYRRGGGRKATQSTRRNPTPDRVLAF